jgi:hypothetical protein
MLRNCTVIGYRGGGVRVESNYSSWDKGPSPTFTNCKIMAAADYGMYLWAASPLLVDCTIEGNGRSGIVGKYFSATLVNCTIARNGSYGVLSEESAVRMTNCRITNNERDGVYSLYQIAWVWLPLENLDCGKFSVTLTNCLIAGNKGYGLYCVDTTPTLVNCTIAENTKGGVYSFIGHFTPDPGQPHFYSCDALPKLLHCVVWNDDAIKTIYGASEPCYSDEDVVYECAYTGEVPPHGLGLDIQYCPVKSRTKSTG